MGKFKRLLKKYIPKKFTFKITHLKKILTPGGFLIKTYSGDGEDIILNRYLFSSKKDGFYVDVGSFHPMHLSNTYQLYKRGWRGMNIDPNPETQAVFQKHRKDDINLQLGVAEEEKELTYYRFAHAGINTFDRTQAEHKASKQWCTLLGEDKIPCKPLRAIFDEHLPANQEIDVLDVDVECLDLEVLKSNDWTKYRPKVVLVEDRDFRDMLTQSPIYHFLNQKGYNFYSYMNITLIMKLEDSSVSSG